MKNFTPKMKNIFFFILKNSFVTGTPFNSEEEEILHNLIHSATDSASQICLTPADANQPSTIQEAICDESDYMLSLSAESSTGFDTFSNTLNDGIQDAQDSFDILSNLDTKESCSSEFVAGSAKNSKSISRPSKFETQSEICNELLKIIEESIPMDLDECPIHHSYNRSKCDSALLKYLNEPVTLIDEYSTTEDMETATPSDINEIRSQDLHSSHAEDANEQAIRALEQRWKNSSKKIYKSKNTFTPKRLEPSRKGNFNIREANSKKGSNTKSLEARNKRRFPTITKLLN